MLKRLKFSKKKLRPNGLDLTYKHLKKNSYLLSVVENAYQINIGQNKSPWKSLYILIFPNT